MGMGSGCTCIMGKWVNIVHRFAYYTTVRLPQLQPVVCRFCSIKASSQIFADYLQNIGGRFEGVGDMAGEATLHGRGKPTDPDPSSPEFLFSNRIYPNHPLLPPPPPPPFHAATNNTGATFCEILYIIYMFSRCNNTGLPLAD